MIIAFSSCSYAHLVIIDKSYIIDFLQLIPLQKFPLAVFMFEENLNHIFSHT